MIKSLHFKYFIFGTIIIKKLLSVYTFYITSINEKNQTFVLGI